MSAVFATRPERYVVLKDLLENRRRDIQEELRSLREALPAEIVDVKDAEEQSLPLLEELLAGAPVRGESGWGGHEGQHWHQNQLETPRSA